MPLFPPLPLLLPLPFPPLPLLLPLPFPPPPLAGAPGAGVGVGNGDDGFVVEDCPPPGLPPAFPLPGSVLVLVLVLALVLVGVDGGGVGEEVSVPRPSRLARDLMVFEVISVTVVTTVPNRPRA